MIEEVRVQGCHQDVKTQVGQVVGYIHQVRVKLTFVDGDEVIIRSGIGDVVQHLGHGGDGEGGLKPRS